MSKKFLIGIETDGGATDSSGIKMTRLTSSSANSTGAPLGVDSSGNVVKIAGSGSPAGSDQSIQYNNAGAFGGLGNVQNFEGNLTFVAYDGSTPSTPSASVLFNKKLGGRHLLGQIGPSGIDFSFQPFLARNRVALWMPPGNATTVPGVFGMAAFTATGTATARNIATTNFTTRQKRLGYVSAGTAGSLAGVRLPAAQFTTGGGGSPAVGGFFLVTRFVASDAATVSGARQFVGMWSSTSAPTNVEPSTLTQCAGVGHGASDTNLKIYYGAGVAQTPIDLGANFPANTLSADTYELTLFSPPSSTTIYYEVQRLNTGHRATGTLSSNTPAATQLLGFQAWRSNNATALAVGIDICSFYLETDN